MRLLLVMILLGQVDGWAVKAQDLTGQWTGSSTDNISGRKQKIVLNIASGDSIYGGVLHSYYPEIQYFRNFIVRGEFHSKDSTLSIRQDSSLEPIVNEAEQGESGPYILYYSHTGHKEILEGHWQRGPSVDPNDKGRELTIRLEKKAPPFIPAPLVDLHKKKDSAQLKLLQPMLARQTPLIMAIPVPVKLDSIKIELFDNGEVDGDSVSLFLNDERIVTHLGLKAEPTVIWLPMDKSLPVNKLILFAENLGRLPPNTAVMEVTIRGKTYTIYLSTDYKRNALVEFILQE